MNEAPSHGSWISWPLVYAVIAVIYLCTYGVTCAKRIIHHDDFKAEQQVKHEQYCDEVRRAGLKDPDCR